MPSFLRYNSKYPVGFMLPSFILNKLINEVLLYMCFLLVIANLGPVFFIIVIVCGVLSVVVVEILNIIHRSFLCALVFVSILCV